MDSLFPSAVRTPGIGLHLNTTSLKAVSNTDTLGTQSHIYRLKNVVSISELFFCCLLLRPWPYRSQTLALISNHASVSSPLVYTLTSPFPFPSFLSSFLFFILPCIPFIFPVTQGLLPGLLLGTPEMGGLRYHDCNTEENIARPH